MLSSPQWWTGILSNCKSINYRAVLGICYYYAFITPVRFFTPNWNYREKLFPLFSPISKRFLMVNAVLCRYFRSLFTYPKTSLLPSGKCEIEQTAVLGLSARAKNSVHKPAPGITASAFCYLLYARRLCYCIYSRLRDKAILLLNALR